MYPQLPELGAEPVPLPLCDGPKLEPFDFKGPQKIEVLGYLDGGLHSHVVKVKIHGQIYALKLFRFCDESAFCPKIDDLDGNFEAWSAIYQYADPFSAECRAYGRLREAGHEDLSGRCFGYVLLEPEAERAVRALTSTTGEHLSIDEAWVGGDEEDGYYGRVTDVYFPKKNAADGGGTGTVMPPLRGILKEFGTGLDRQLNAWDCRRYLNFIKKVQQLGIFSLDLCARQLIGGKHVDFSMSITTPHFVTNPELNPAIDPECIPLMEQLVFESVMRDYWDYDTMLRDQNSDNWDRQHHNSIMACYREYYGPNFQEDVLEPDPEGYRRFNATAFALPGEGTLEPKYSLRRLPHRQRAWAYVDPRKYDWSRIHEGDDVEKTTRSPGKGRPVRVPKSQQRHHPYRLSRMPSRWYLDCSDELAAKLRKQRRQLNPVVWEFKDGGIIPCDLKKKRKAHDAKLAVEHAKFREALLEHQDRLNAVVAEESI